MLMSRIRSTSVPSDVAMRAATERDGPFLRDIFIDARPDLAWLPAPLVELQAEAFRRHLRAHRPHACTQIVSAAGIDVGSLIVDDTDAHVAVVDLAVATEHRGHGIGTSILQKLAAAAAPRPVVLTVWAGNMAARRLYARLGFIPTATADGYTTMERES
jgi:ribosomal protein S18 acetylase RimI-like enzyme